MPKAIKTSTTSTRRNVLALTGRAGLLAVAAGTFARPEALASAPEHASPDAALIGLCAEFHRLHNWLNTSKDAFAKESVGSAGAVMPRRVC